MAAAKPIIAAGENELKHIIEKAKCGFIAEPDNAEELKNCVLRFIEHDNKKELAENARKFYEENFSKDLFFERLEKLIKEV